MYGKRQEAKNQGNKTFSYVYKILMNSLYGRFGRNPLSRMTFIASSLEERDLLVKERGFISADEISDNRHIVVYFPNMF